MYWLRWEDSPRPRSNCIPREPDSKLFLKSTCWRSQIMARSSIPAAATMPGGLLNLRTSTSRIVRRSGRSSLPVRLQPESTAYLGEVNCDAEWRTNHHSGLSARWRVERWGNVVVFEVLHEPIAYIY